MSAQEVQLQNDDHAYLFFYCMEALSIQRPNTVCLYGYLKFKKVKYPPFLEYIMHLAELDDCTG